MSERKPSQERSMIPPKKQTAPPPAPVAGAPAGTATAPPAATVEGQPAPERGQSPGTAPATAEGPAAAAGQAPAALPGLPPAWRFKADAAALQAVVQEDRTASLILRLVCSGSLTGEVHGRGAARVIADARVLFLDDDAGHLLQMRQREETELNARVRQVDQRRAVLVNAKLGRSLAMVPGAISRLVANDKEIVALDQEKIELLEQQQVLRGLAAQAYREAQRVAQVAIRGCAYGVIQELRLDSQRLRAQFLDNWGVLLSHLFVNELAIAQLNDAEKQLLGWVMAPVPTPAAGDAAVPAGTLPESLQG